MANAKLKPKAKSNDVIDEVMTAEEKAPVYDSSIVLDENGVSEPFEFLCGYTDSNGVLHKTFTVREMNGKDEEALSKGEVKQNPSKAITILLERCLVSIGSLTKKDLGTANWKKVIQGLYGGDQDLAVLKIREVSLGREIEVSHVCPHCGAKLKTFVDLSELAMIPFKGLEKIPFELPRGVRDRNGVVHREGFLRLPNGLDREILVPIAKKNLAQGTTMLLTRCIEFSDEGVYVTNDLMSNMVSRDREYLNELLQENNFGVELGIEVTCTECGDTFDGTFNPVNFI